MFNGVGTREEPREQYRKGEGEDKKDEQIHVIIAIIDNRPLFMDLLAELMSTRIEDCSVIPVSCTQELAEKGVEALGAISLALLNVGNTRTDDRRVRDSLNQLKSAFNDPAVILLADGNDYTQIGSALRQGVRGYVPTSLTSSALIEAVRLVRAGGLYVPADALIDAFNRFSLTSVHENRRVVDDNKTSEPALTTFTDRQLQVLDLLCKGKSNKLIAYELDVQESTVKVHIRQIMRKLKATNRTEAALWAQRAVADRISKTAP